MRAFRKVLGDNHWTLIDDGSTYRYSDDVVITVERDRWQMFRLDDLICEGGYAEKAYAVVEACLQQIGLLE